MFFFMGPGMGRDKGEIVMRFSFGLKSVLLAATAVMICPLAAHAQDAAGAATDTTLEEIVVTAQKREQVLFDVPMSISAIGGQEIERRGAQAIEDLQYSVPGLSITQFAPGSQRVQMRGVSVYSGLPTVGVYVDELPLNGELSQTGQDVRMLDMERVEVLRGPQGTLYGQGAMGGTIRYLTKSPDLTAFGGRIAGEVGAVDDGGTDWQVEGVVNLPIVEDKFGVRIAGAYQEFGGWIDNPTLGLKDINSGSASTIRAKALLKVNEQFKVSLLLSHQTYELSAQNFADEDGKNFEALTTPIDSESTFANLIATYDFGPVTLLSSTGWIHRKDTITVDLTRTFVPFLEAPLPFGLGFPAGTFDSIGLTTHYESKIFAQEVRLTSNGDNRLNWTVGAMFRDSKATSDADAEVTPDIVPIALLTTRGTSPSNSRSWAVFGELTYKIMDNLEATVGGRYFEDKRKQDAFSSFFGIASVDKNSDTFTAFSPRFNLLWRATDDLNLYVNVAKGFRSGGFNLVSSGLGVVDVPPTYDPETLWSYEVGGKFQTSDRKVVAELAVYRNEWTDVQSLAFAPGSPVQYTVNGAELAGWGVDAQLVLRPVTPLTLTFTGGWNNMQYETTTIEHFEGDRADYVPRYTASASAEYRFNWGANLPGFARVDYQITDGYQVYVRNVQLVPARADTQRYLNARIGLDTGRFGVALFAKNILNEDGMTYPAFAALYVPARAQPRVLGVAVSMDF
jgi:iron complex outermembrane receptor protein